MFRKVEEVEAAPKATPSVIETQEQALVQEEAPLHDQDAVKAELTACVETARLRIRKRLRGARVRLYAIFGVLLTVIPSLIILINSGEKSLQWGLRLSTISALSSVAFIVYSYLEAGINLRSDRMAAKKLAKIVVRLGEIEDRSEVALLIDTLSWLEDKTLSSQLFQALGRLLPLLSEDEALELGKERHYKLAAMIRNWDHPLIRRGWEDQETVPLIGMLHVMAHVGQNRFQFEGLPAKMSINLLPTLEKWVDGHGVGQNPAVRRAAEACRDAILQKMALAKSGAQLLRASAPATAGPETLLRPAQSAEQADPQELLRPDNSE